MSSVLSFYAIQCSRFSAGYQPLTFGKLIVSKIMVVLFFCVQPEGGGQWKQIGSIPFVRNLTLVFCNLKKLEQPKKQVIQIVKRNKRKQNNLPKLIWNPWLIQSHNKMHVFK